MRARRVHRVAAVPGSRPRKVSASVPARPIDQRTLPPTITEETFRSMTQHGLPLFVRFSSPHCGHSRAMEPAWNLLRRDFPMVVTTIDCTGSQQLCRECGIRGFPTLRLYLGGSDRGIEYPGGRSYRELKTWLSAALR